MWTRAMLKENAKAALKKNYVNVVVVSLIFSFISGAFSSSSTSNRGISSVFSGNFSEELYSFVSMLMGMAIIAGIFGIIIKIFIFNPLEVGIKKFFIDNHYANPTLGVILWAFKTNYMNIVKTMFLRDVYLILWSLLFIIPGIIKTYSYRLVPYILAENPDMDADGAITLSRELMDGEKLDTFILDLSFILWNLLAIITLNIAGILYVYPYTYATSTELYLVLASDSPYNRTGYSNDNFYDNGGNYD